MTKDITVNYPLEGTSFFEVRVTAQDSDGHAFRDTISVCASSFAQAEQFAAQHYEGYAALSIAAIKKCPYRVVFTGRGGTFFSCTARLVTDVTGDGREKYELRRYLVQHDNIPGARLCVNDYEGEDITVSVVSTSVTAFFNIQK